MEVQVLSSAPVSEQLMGCSDTGMIDGLSRKEVHNKISENELAKFELSVCNFVRRSRNKVSPLERTNIRAAYRLL